MSEDVTVAEKQSFHEAVTAVVNNHINAVGKENITDLHRLVIETVEEPLCKSVIEQYRGNQSAAAKALGVSRGTLRKQLNKYFGNRYFRLTE